MANKEKEKERGRKEWREEAARVPISPSRAYPKNLTSSY
jgi:hypothetical protein